MSQQSVGADTFAITFNGRDLPITRTFDVINPATGRAFAKAPGITASQLDEVMSTADRAFATWRIDEGARIAALHTAAEVVEANADYLASIVTAEQGMPLHDAQAEVGRAVEWIRYYATLEVPRELVQDDASGYQEVFRRPLGVVAAITPWNFPVSLSFWKIAPALRAGNTVVLKPSAYTPLSMLEVARLLRDVFPPGVLTVVTDEGSLGAQLVDHPLTRKISFTGSTEVGRKVGVSAIQKLKRVTLELGGNDPAIILEDANLDNIGQSVFWSGFMNNGQVCMAAKRVYVHEKIYDEVVEAVAQVAKNIPVGDGATPGHYLGPVNNKQQFDRVTELVDQAVSEGAKVAAGGQAIGSEGYFYQPTVLTGLADRARVVHEEQFGPVMPIIPFRSEEEAIALANDSQYGLTASVWSADYDRALAVAARLDSGQVGLNFHGLATRVNLPFSGRKDSGIGVENGLWGYYGYTETQAVAGFPRTT